MRTDVLAPDLCKSEGISSTDRRNPFLVLHSSPLRNADWFSEGGVTPDGKWWIAPTPLFLEQIWQGGAGDDLKKRGFRLGHDGHRIGAAQHTVIYLPTTLVGKELA